MHRKHVVLKPHHEASERTLAAPRLLASALAALLVLAACTSTGESAPGEPSEPAAPAAPSAPAQTSQRLFTNGSFEDGSLTGWTSSTNLNPGITIPVTSETDLHLQPGGNNFTYARNAPAGPETQIPAGLDATASLRWPKYGNWAAVVNENGLNRNVNRLVQSATIGAADVDPADGKVHVRFALAPVLQNPGHAANQQPYIYIVLRNVTRSTVLWSTFNFANQTGVPWKTLGQVQYTDWQSVDVAPGDASLSVGDSVQLDIISAGCSQGGHWGHVYVDGFGSFLPGLSIAASAPQFANDDTDLTYTYLAKNSGATATSNTLVTIVLPANTAYVSFSGANCTRATNNGVDTLTCDLGTLNPTASAQFDVTVHINQGATGSISHGNYSIQADNVSPLIGPLVVTNLSAGVPYSDLAITLTDGVSALAWGDPVQYTMVVTNNGPVAATGAAIDDDFPAQLTGITWTCAGSNGATCATASGSGNLHVTNDIPVGGQLTFTVNATVITGTGSGTLNDRASVTVATSARDNDTTNNVAVDIDGIGTLYTLTVSKDPAGNGAGTIVSSPSAINCDANCTSANARFLEGSQVSLTATAAPGSTFAGWGGACASQPNPCVIDINAAASVTALFTLNTYPVSSSTIGGGGTLSCPTPVGHGQSATCTITPEPGYVLATLTDNTADVSGSVSGNTYVISNVTGPHEVVATFKKALGTSCGGDSECVSNLCADGVCCNSACNGQCEACNVAGSVGTCSAVTGAPHTGHQACDSDGSVCGGACNGSNRTACTYPGASTECRAGSCSGGVATLPATCDGAGACPGTSQTQQCNPYVCGPNACLDHCSTDADCAGNRFCDAGACVDRKDNGGSCTADSQCASGSCADGVCCNTSCDGQCEACNVAGSVGTCSAVTGAPRGDRPACAADGSECGGVCNGTVRNACTYPAATTHCGAEACTDGVATTGGTCNGAGACGQQTQSCGLYACGDKACNTSCTSDSECSAGGICLSGQCMDRADRTLWKAEGSGCSSTGSGSSLGATLVLAVLALISRRRKSVGAMLSTAAVLSVPAAAQAQDDVDRSFTVERFQPQPGQADVLGVQSARTGENLSFSARLFASYAHQPLRLVSTADSSFRRLMVGNQSQFTLTASMAFQDRFEVGLAVPVLLHQTTQTIGIIDPRLDGGLHSTAIEDLRLSAKASLLRDEDYGLAVSLPITLPTAPGDNYVGGSGVTFNPTVIGELAGPRGSSFMANAGLLLGRSRQFLNLDLGTALTYGVGGKVDLVPRWNLAFLTTLAGEVGLSHPSAETSPLELLLGLRWGFLKNMEATLGAGPGLTNGYGTPRYRILAALSWVPGSKPAPTPAPVIAPAPPPPAPAPPPPPPALVARPDETKVVAGEAVSVNVLGNDEGAPGEAIKVVAVSSPSGGQVELLPDGTLKYTARPGFSGREELTYKITGADGREATGTLIVNVEAPPPPPPPPAAAVVDVSSGKIRVLEKVNFATNKDNVLAESLHILDDVYSIMSSDASIKKVRIEAHTDNRGTPSYNKDLSDRRAKWVKNYLIQKGIDPSRLESAGFGQTRPIATNDTVEGRATNRRVEFVILP